MGGEQAGTFACAPSLALPSGQQQDAVHARTMVCALQARFLSTRNLMPPPPTPTSLMDLPASWLLKLATHNMPYHEGRTAVSLFPTCAFFRDTVLQHRTAVAEFRVPIAAERFPAELARLCTVARRSSNVKLRFGLRVDDDDDDSSSAPWTRTEPHITHLLVCAMAELGGPLTCVKKVHTKVSKLAWRRSPAFSRCSNPR